MGRDRGGRRSGSQGIGTGGSGVPRRSDAAATWRVRAAAKGRRKRAAAKGRRKGAAFFVAFFGKV